MSDATGEDAVGQTLDGEPQGMGLSSVAAHSLAWRLIARLASDWSAHIDWEDVPELGEYAWEHLAEHLDEVALSVMERSQNFDRNFDVDSADLLSQARDDSGHIGRDDASVQGRSGGFA